MLSQNVKDPEFYSKNVVAEAWEKGWGSKDGRERRSSKVQELWVEMAQ